MKICSVCGKEKRLEDFYKHARCRDGREGTCKQCKIESARKYYFGHLEEKKKYFRDYTQNNKEKVNRWSKERRLRHPDIEKAHVAVNNRMRYGIIKKQPCEVCGIFPAEKHHPDYSKPLEIKWLCRKHHRELHKELGPVSRDPRELLR